LSIGASDVRHILQTVGNMTHGETCKLKFFIIEKNIELVARQTVQIYLLSRPNSELGIQEISPKAGWNNLPGVLLSSNDATYWPETFRFVTNEASLSSFRPLLNYKILKFKERDLLECIFKMWRKKTLKEYNISTYWDSRVRQHLGTRYDAIPNVFDWDCSITLQDRGAIITLTTAGTGNTNMRWCFQSPLVVGVMID
uniref:FBA_2 domain-containing protein n=1 Tax=Schistocephalus solidus TaxID=70667 RepID=A0A183SKS0_SCHSO